MCFIGVLKFIFKSEQYFNYSSEISLLIIIFTIASLLYILISLIITGDKDFSLLTNFSTGVLIFSPVLFCDNIIEVFAIGVGMHYMQYIAITWTVFHRKAIRKNEIGDKQFVKVGSLKNNYLFIILFITNGLFFKFKY